MPTLESDTVVAIDGKTRRRSTSKAEASLLRLVGAFAANNLAIVRHIVMNLLRLNRSRKGRIRTKRMLAATSDQFGAEVLGVMT